MKIGWDENKYDYELCRLICQKVKKVLEEYIDIYRQYSTRDDKEDFKLFVSGLTKKISFCLEEPF